MLVLIIFILFVLVVVVLIEVHERRRVKDISAPAAPVSDPNCCGAHLVCEKELAANPITKIVYYDDEELDEYKGIASDAYSEEQVKCFADILYTMRENDVSGWLRSLHARNINLPDQLKEEALLIVREHRSV